MATTTSKDRKLPAKAGSAEPKIKKARRGFAAMDPATRAEISSMGGRAAHAAGTAHQWTSEEAVEVGRKGGNAPHVSRGGKRGPGAKKAQLELEGT